VKQYDPYSGNNLWMPPSAVIPGVIAYNDQVGEVWYAPAGVNRGQVPNAIAVEYPVQQSDVEAMYGPGNGNAINPIQSFPESGITVFGQRTLQRFPSALDRINVRRLMFYIEQSIAKASRSLIFEQDDAILWGQWLGLVNPFLSSLLGQRALDWYQAVCDSTTNTADTENNNMVCSTVYVIPRKTCEVWQVNFTLLASGASISTFLAQDQGLGTNA
jgi:hypothetical protein